MSHLKTPTLGLAGGVAIALLLAGCAPFSNASTPLPTLPSGVPSPGVSISTETATPSPTQRLVKSIALVATIGEPQDWTPAGLTWIGIQKVSAQIGSAATLVEPVSSTELPADLKLAAAAATVVVTVGPGADPAVQAVAAAYPTTQFLEMGVVVPDPSPANVHGLVFDEAEAGYLGGYVAAWFAGPGSKVGFIGNDKTDVSSINYGSGVLAGAAELEPGVPVVSAYAGTSYAPDRGRAAAATVVKAGGTVIVAPLSLSGIGALREACSRKARIVGLGMDAWQIVPDIQPCVIVSVLERDDTAVTAAILSIAGGRQLPALTVSDAASGGLSLSDFHATLPAGFQAGLDELMASLQAGPPRPTAESSATASPKATGSSPNPSGT